MKQPDEITLRRVLNEKATPDEAAEVAAWFATDEGQSWLAAEFDNDARQLESGAMAPLSDIPGEELLRRIERILTRARRRRLLLRVAAILIPCALIVGLWANLNSRLGGALFSADKQQTVAAAVGERKEVIFQDGTRIFLNAGSTISYPERFGLSERRVQLDGEAYFEVAHNPQRPFVVETSDNASVRVLGTEFDVKAYRSDPTISVVLIRGSVEFARGISSYRLEPSQRLVYNKQMGTSSIESLSNADQTILWSHNTIYFRDTPMQEVIQELERWYDVQFEVADPKVYNFTFSLQTPNLPLRELLNELENIAPIRCSVNNKTVEIHSMK